MGKTGDTKKKIYGMLEQKNKTLTDISNELGLAPSTVSQHLQEMVDSGTIRLVEDRPRKWKYYEINREYPISSGYLQANNSKREFDFRKVALPMAVVAVAIISVFVFYMTGSTGYATAQQVYLAPGSSVPVGSTVFSVSDAPSFYNISSLMVRVNNASIHSETTGKWYNIPLQASTFDLVQLDNIPSVLSGVNLKNGIYDDMVLHISNVTATINGTVEPVTLPSDKLTIVGAFNITNGTPNWLNLDFDLAHSLHITDSGEIIMLPVINVRHVNDTNLEINETSAIIAGAPWHMEESMEFGMDQNGSMMHNFTTPQNLSINAGADGHFIISGNGSIPIIMRGAHGLIIGGDATGLITETDSGMNSSSTSYINEETAYRRCIDTSASINGTAANEAAILKGCCIGTVQPMLNGSISANSTAWTGNSTAVISGSFYNTSSCCYPIDQLSPGGKISVRRCLPVGPVPAANGIRAYPQVWSNNSIKEQLNISMPNGNGNNISASCTLQNGALSCTSEGSARPRDIAAGIGRITSSGWGANGSDEDNAAANATASTGIVNINGSANVAVGCLSVGNRRICS